MHLHAEIRTLPPGVALAAQRRHHDGHDVIVVAVADTTTGLASERRQDVLDMFCQAVNALWDAPERHGPVTMPLAS